MAVVKLVTRICSVGTTITFLFKEANWTSDLRLNYKMGLKPIQTISIVGTIEKVGILVMTLNKLKTNIK